MDMKRRLYHVIVNIVIAIYVWSISYNYAVESDVIITIVSQPEGCHDIGSRIVHKYDSVRVDYTGKPLAHEATVNAIMLLFYNDCCIVYCICSCSL